MEHFEDNQQGFPNFREDFDPTNAFLDRDDDSKDADGGSGDQAYGNESENLINGTKDGGIYHGDSSTYGNTGNKDLDDGNDSNQEGSNTSSVQGRRKAKRTRATGEALEILKREFHVNPSPNAQNRKRISELTGLPEKNVRIWFQNRRSKFRKTDRRLKGPGATESTAPVSSFEFDRIPLNINSSYYFIDISSLTVGSWKRLKSGNLSADCFPQIEKLFNLSPISINTTMANATDLMVLISKKNCEINYFFSAIANNTKILFRIFFPINTVVNCSLSLDTTESLQTESQDSHSPPVLEDGNETSSPKLAELRLSLSKSPKFAVYFSESNDDASSNQWSICEDFSEGRQVNDAYIGGSNMPHVLTGLDESLKFMNSLILDLNNTEHFVAPNVQIQHGVSPSLQRGEQNSGPLTYTDDPNVMTHDASTNPASNGQSSFLSTNDIFSTMPFDNYSSNIPKTPDFLNSTNLQENQGMSSLMFQDQQASDSTN